MAGAYSVNKSYFDVAVTLAFAVIAWPLYKLDFPTVPILLGLCSRKHDRDQTSRRALLHVRRKSCHFCQQSTADRHLIILDHRRCGNDHQKQITGPERSEKGLNHEQKISSSILLTSRGQTPARLLWTAIDITPEPRTRLAAGGVRFDNAFSPQPGMRPLPGTVPDRAHTATETGCFRNNIMLPRNVRPWPNYIEEAGLRQPTSENGIWPATVSLKNRRPIDHTVTAVPQ
ncbi:MAG: hypothetical protein ACLUD2_21450 [Clostridium sp.]